MDLNLLVVLEAVLAEQHVSRASMRLGMSQPAVSHALLRLRAMFDDPLLVRKNGALVPTAKANQLAPLLSSALHQVRVIMGPGHFDAASETRQFKIAMSDYGSSVLLPPLMRELRRKAPGIQITVTHSDRQSMMRQVMDGEVDLALGVFRNNPPEINESLLFEERFVCLVASDTLDASKTLSTDAYLLRSHVLVAMSELGGNEIDVELARMGCSRKIALTLPHWGVSNLLIADTDLVLTVASRALDTTQLDPRTVILDPPFIIQPFPFTMNWHDRRTQDPAHQWLRQTVTNAVGL